jgi:hypothetical protein
LGLPVITNRFPVPELVYLHHLTIFGTLLDRNIDPKSVQDRGLSQQTSELGQTDIIFGFPVVELV